MVNCYHGTENLPVQFSCPSQSKLHSLLENKGMISMEQENGKMPWRESDKLRMCNAVKSDELWNSTFKYKQLNELQSHVIASKLNIAPIEKFAANLMSKLITDALLVSCKITWSIPCSQICHMSDSLPLQENLGNWSGLRLCWTPELFQESNNRGSSRSSLSSRLSSSHNSLATDRVDESSFISSAASHDVLSSSQSSDIYNVPLDSDNYAVPIDVKSDNPKPPLRTKKRHVQERQLRSVEKVPVRSTKGRKFSSQSIAQSAATRSSLRSSSGFKDSRPACSTSEPIHLTLQEVRQCIHDLYESTSEESGNRDGQDTFRNIRNPFNSVQSKASAVKSTSNYKNNIIINNNNCYNKNRKNAFSVMVRSKRAKENCESSNGSIKKSSPCRPSFSLSLKQALCNIFRFKRLPTPDQCLGKRETIFHSDEIGVRLSGHDDQNPPSPITKPPLSNRALPPLPKLKENRGDIIATDSTPIIPSPEDVPPLPPRGNNTKQSSNRKDEDEKSAIDFASSIEKVKDYGWYWGPISGEAAEKILSNEPDGSFIVRDSSDNYYIFSLTFKLNSVIRHVRIEHDRGKFSFGSSHRFKSNTIVDFIESAVEHSRSGRYLFFLHRRPVLGPMRVQLLHPVSRFKRVQSLQHLCRFVILKLVRKDLIRDLPLPTRVLDYLSKQHYYSEQLFEDEESDSSFQEELNQFMCFSNEKFS